MAAADEEHELAQLKPFQEAVSLVPTQPGRKLNYRILYRWSSDGLQGVRLRYVNVGGTRATTAAWLREFFEEVAAAKSRRGPEAPSPASPRAAGRRQRDSERAEEELSRRFKV